MPSAHSAAPPSTKWPSQAARMASAASRSALAPAAFTASMKYVLDKGPGVAAAVKRVCGGDVQGQVPEIFERHLFLGACFLLQVFIDDMRALKRPVNIIHAVVGVVVIRLGLVVPAAVKSAMLHCGPWIFRTEPRHPIPGERQQHPGAPAIRRQDAPDFFRTSSRRCCRPGPRSRSAGKQPTFSMPAPNSSMLVAWARARNPSTVWNS